MDFLNTTIKPTPEGILHTCVHSYQQEYETKPQQINNKSRHVTSSTTKARILPKPSLLPGILKPKPNPNLKEVEMLKQSLLKRNVTTQAPVVSPAKTSSTAATTVSVTTVWPTEALNLTTASGTNVLVTTLPQGLPKVVSGLKKLKSKFNVSSKIHPVNPHLRATIPVNVSTSFFPTLKPTVITVKTTKPPLLLTTQDLKPKPIAKPSSYKEFLEGFVQYLQDALNKADKSDLESQVPSPKLLEKRAIFSHKKCKYIIIFQFNAAPDIGLNPPIWS